MEISDYVDDPPPIKAAGDVVDSDDEMASALTRAFGTPTTTKQIGPYRLERLINIGSTAAVHEAVDTRDGRVVAVKYLVGGGFAHPAVVARFRREVERHRAMDHQHIAVVLDADTYDPGNSGQALPYLVLEYVDGPNIVEYAKQHGCDIPEVLALVLQLCEAMEYAHRHKMLHRDLKPGNVLVTQQGMVKVIDFGLVRTIAPGPSSLHTMTGVFVGTPAYMSPEQAIGRHSDIGHASDVYSIAAITYELLTGTTPIDLTDATNTLAIRRIAEVEPTPMSVASGRLGPAITPQLEAIVMKGLEKSQERRYHSVSDFAADLRAYLSGRPQQARPPGVWTRLSRFRRRNARIFWTGLIAVAFVLLVAALTAFGWWRENRARAMVEAMQLRTRHALADEMARRGLDASNSGDPAIALLFQARAIELEEQEPVDPDRVRDARFRFAAALKSTSGAPMELSGQARLAQFEAWDLDPRITISPGAAHEQPFSTTVTASVVDHTTGRVAVSMHRGRIYQAALSGNKLRLATAGRDQTARLVSVDTQEIVREKKLTAAVWSTAFSPDSRTVAFCDWESNLEIWDAETGQDRFVRKYESMTPTYLAFSGNGKLLAVLGDDGGLRVIDVATGELRLTVPRTPQRPLCAALNHDGSRSLVGCINGAVYHTNLDSAQSIRLIEVLRHSEPVARVTFSGEYIVVVTGEGDGYRDELKNHRAFERQTALPSKAIWTLHATESCRSHSGRWVGALVGNEWHLIGAADGKIVARCDAPFPQMPGLWQVNESGQIAAISADGARLVVRDMVTGKILIDNSHSDGGWFSSLHFDAHGSRLLAGRRRVVGERSLSMMMFDVSNSKLLWEPVLLSDPDACIGIDASGKKIAVGMSDGKNLIYSADRGTIEKELPQHNARCWTPCLSPDGRYAVTSSFDGSGMITDLQDPDRPPARFQHDDSIEGVEFDETRQIVITAARDCSVRGWRLSDGKLVFGPLVHADAVSSPYLVDSSTVLLVNSPVSGAQLWSMRTHSPLSSTLPAGWLRPREDSLQLHFSMVQGLTGLVDFSPDPRPLGEIIKAAQSVSLHKLDANNQPIPRER